MTVVIYDNGDDGISFFITDKNTTGLDGAYLNGDITTKQRDRLNEILYDDNFDFKVDMLKQFPVDAVKSGAKVIVCGCYW